MNVQLRGEKLSKWYGDPANRTVALDSASLNIKSGEFVAIIGPSGSGKSTLMNILGCLDKPSGGKYFFDGKLVSEMSENSLATVRNTKIGFIFQSFNLLPRTSSMRNVELPLVYAGVKRAEREAKAREMLEKVGLSHRFESTPAKLSGGEQQRVAIARALINEPLIIFADEPTGNLDSKSSAEILEIFKKLNREGKTIVMVTHETDIASQARRIISMHDGKIVSDKINKPTKAKAYEKRKGV